MTGLEGYWYDNPTSISDTEEVQTRLADDVEVITDNHLKWLGPMS
jgi:hypothetical protein